MTLAAVLVSILALGAAPDPGAGEPSAPPEAAAPSGETAPAAVPAPPSRAGPREFGLAGGIAALKVLDVRSTGWEVHGAYATPAVHLVADLFVGETAAGLDLYRVALGGELRKELLRVLRLGIGLDGGLVAYDRVTTGKTEWGLAVGARGGAEVALLRFETGALVAGVHGGARIGGFFYALSAGVSLGFRFGDLAARPPRAR